MLQSQQSSGLRGLNKCCSGKEWRLQLTWLSAQVDYCGQAGSAAMLKGKDMNTVGVIGVIGVMRNTEHCRSNRIITVCQ